MSEHGAGIRCPIRETLRLLQEHGGTPDTYLVEIPDDEMQECLEAGELGGTPSEVRALTLAYAKGMQRVLDLIGQRP